MKLTDEQKRALIEALGNPGSQPANPEGLPRGLFNRYAELAPAGRLLAEALQENEKHQKCINELVAEAERRDSNLLKNNLQLTQEVDRLHSESERLTAKLRQARNERDDAVRRRKAACRERDEYIRTLKGARSEATKLQFDIADLRLELEQAQRLLHFSAFLSQDP